MQKLNHLQSIEKSQLEFSRRQKRPYTLNHQCSQIKDYELLQRMQLIFNSLRQQSLKQTKYFLSQKQKLYQEVNYQNRVIMILQEENRLLRSHVELYMQKCGGLCKNPVVESPRGRESFAEIIVQSEEYQQEEQKKQEKEKQRSYDKFPIKIDRIKSRNVSSTSLNHNQNNNISSDKKQSLNNPPPIIHLNNSAKDCESLNDSLSSNFYKKKVPFHHRRQSSLQRQEYNRINRLPIVTRFQQYNNSSQVSEISCVNSRKGTFVDRLKDEEETYNEREEQQQIYSHQQVDFSNLHSNVSEFFNQNQKYRYHQAVREQQDLLAREYENKYDGLCEQSLVRYFEQIEETSREDQHSFNSAKIDSDIRRMEDALQAQFGTHNQQQKNQEKLIEIIGRQQEHKEQHPSYSKQTQKIHNGSEQIHDSFNKIHQISAEKRFRDMFTPLPDNVLSRKINLPITIKNVPKKHQIYLKESNNLSEILQSLRQFDRNKILTKETQNPLQIAVKRLKKQNKFQGMR